MTKSATIILAGETYGIDELDIGQLIDLNVALTPDAEEKRQRNELRLAHPGADEAELQRLANEQDPKGEMRRSFERSLDIVAAALASSHPDLTVEKLRRMKMAPKELNRAVTMILWHAGLTAEAPSDTGEGEPAKAG